MKRAVALLRVSSAGQTKRAGSEEGYSIEVQREGCLRKAAVLEAEVIEEIVGPAESASKGIYPALRRAMQLIRERGDVDYLVVYRLDRLSRDELTQFTVLAELKLAGCQLVSATESIDETPQGMLAMGILASVNAYRSRDDGRKITEGRLRKALVGGTPYRVRPGYLNVRQWDGANDIRTVTVDEERAPHIKWAFAAYATGEYSMTQLVEDLWDRGLRTRPTAKRPPGKLSKSALAELLQDPYYIGVVRFKGAEYQGVHPPLIDTETFQKVQEVLAARRLAKEKHWRHGHFLKGTLFCGFCGTRLRYTQVRGNGGTYQYFVCSTRHGGSSCTQRYLSPTDVEEAVARYYGNTVRFDAERVKSLETDLTAAFELLASYHRREARRLKRKVTDLRDQRRRLLNAHLAGAVDQDLLREKQHELGADLALAESNLASSERAAEKPNRGLRHALKLLTDSSAAYLDAGPNERRAWNQAFFTRLFVKPLEGRPEIAGAELTEPFGALLAEDLAKHLQKLPREPAALRADGSNVKALVELGGLEPPPFRLPAGRSPN